MARLNYNRKDIHPLQQLNTALSTAITGELTQTVSLESVSFITGNGPASTQVDNELSGLQASLENIFIRELGAGTSSDMAKLGFSGTMKDSQREALALVGAALSSSKAASEYRAAAMTVSTESAGVLAVIEPSNNPALGYLSDEVSLEAFDNRMLENLRGFNLMFAFSAAVQDEAAELAFRTVTLSPDNAGLEVTLRRTMIQEEHRHEVTGKFVEWRQRNLLDAVTDPSIIINKTTKIYPRVIVGDAVSERNFADKTKIAPVAALANGGAPIDTAPLRPGVKINLIAISQNDKIPGQSDQTDSLDHSLKVTKLYYEVTSTGGTSVIAFDTKGLEGNGFLKADNGRDRRVDLNFDYKDLIVNGSTLDITGVPAVALAPLTAAPYENTQVRLGALVSGDGNLQFGTIRVSSTDPEFAEGRIIDPVDGSYEEIVDETTINALKAMFTGFTLIGYEVEAARSNINRRQIGLLIDSVEERIRYVVPLSSPISVQTPITDTPTAADLAGPLNAQRLVNSINAVTKILEVRDTLKNVQAQIGYTSPTDPVPAIEGFARLMVRPMLHEDTINVANIMTSVSSSNRTADVMAAIVNKVRFAVTQLYTESRYQPALDSLNGTTGERPTVLVITDPTTASYMAVQGDWRTIVGFDVKVATSYDIRFRNKIFATFIRPSVTDVDIMSFGAMAYIPELVTNAMIPYNGSNTQVTQVQNRTLHVCFLPVMAWIEVEGLEQAASKEVEFSVDL